MVGAAAGADPAGGWQEEGVSEEPGPRSFPSLAWLRLALRAG